MRSARNTEVRGGLQHRHLVVRRLDAERAIDIGQVAGDTAQFADQQGDRSHIEDDRATHIDLGLMLDRDADPAVADPAHGAGDFERGEECRRHPPSRKVTVAPSPAWASRATACGSISGISA